MRDDPRVTVPAELVDALREAVRAWGNDNIIGDSGLLAAARALVDSTWDEGLQKSLDSAMPGWRSSIDHGSRGWEATANGWRCTECHHEVVGPVDVHIDAAHVCAPVPVSDEAEAAYHREFQGPPMDKWLAEREKECFVAGFRAARQAGKDEQP